jgi:hypothetical protein
VDRGDGRHQGEAEAEAIVAGAVVEPGERQEQPVDLVGWHDRAGVDDPHQGRAVLCGGRDRDGATRDVVALSVVEQVGDEPFEQHSVAGHQGFAERGGRRDAPRGTPLQRVFGDGGQVQRVGEGTRLIVAREHQQYLDEPLGVIDGLADVGGHRHQLVARRFGLGEDNVHGGAHEGQRRAKLMACVGDELPLAGEGAVEPFEHHVEGVGELTQLVTRALQSEALGQVLLTCRAGSCGEPVHRPQDAPGDDPPRDRGEEYGAGQAEQRVGQQVGERRAALRSGAGLDTSGIHQGALLHDVGAARLRRLEAPRERLLDPRRDPGGRRRAQGVRDEHVGDQYQRGPAEGEERCVDQRQPRPGTEEASHSR